MPHYNCGSYVFMQSYQTGNISMDTCICLCLARSALQVDEMEKAVDVAEKNMTRFGLTTQEIRSRRSWVHDTRKMVSPYT